MPKVLIVDDEPMVRRLLVEVLRDGDFEPFEADCVEAARAAFGRCLPDVVLVDKNLPDGSGLELIRELKANDPHVQAILITAYATLESAIEAIEVGAFDYVVKPFEHLPGLLLKVRNAADKSRLLRLEGQLRHMQKMEALGRLAGGVAHDFNNLLCVVLNCTTEALADVTAGETGPHTAEALDDILRAVDSATRLTRQLLAFSRRPAGKVELLDVNEVVREMRSMLSRLLGSDIELLLALDAGAGRVRMSRTHLEQVLANLVVNARDAIARRGTLTIETMALDEKLGLTVRDTGSGMPPEVSARIFEPFFTTKAVGQGTGLGLAMVRTIVDEAGGEISVESQLGIGTSFCISLPCVDEVPLAASEPSAEPLPQSRGQRVLIVEDDDALREVLERMFLRAGYLVTTARDGEDALERFAARGGAFDLLITDMEMPHRSGSELAALLSREQPALKTVYISGHADHAPIEAAGALVTPVLAKPFGERELGVMIRRVLDAAAA
ncbi:MAG: signal transduction histidine kinase, nitrogen specific, NtrB [Myxococcales bacterium]|nr:signal transduction histidine kinase, nitrogen specific, NtrB [Myxococcales bacterium]